MRNIHIVNLLIKHPTENKILVVKRSPKDKIFGDMYALPGGKIETNETIEKAAQRELLEETGARLKEMENKPSIVSPLKIGNSIYNIGIFKAKIADYIFNPQDSDIANVEYIEPYVLINSLIEHNYPSDQTLVLEQFFLANGYL